jgi:hypothetical protein
MNVARNRGRALAIFVAIALLALAVLAPDLSLAQVAPAAVPSTLAGTWVQEGDAARAMQTVQAAFASTVATLPELLQGFARDRIRSDMEPPRRVVVVLDPARIRVTLEASHTTVVAGPLGGAATTSGVQDGTTVTPRLSSGWLDLVYAGEGSELHQLYSTEPDGARMHLDFTVTGPRLPAPVRYRLEYVHPQ